MLAPEAHSNVNHIRAIHISLTPAQHQQINLLHYSGGLTHHIWG